MDPLTIGAIAAPILGGMFGQDQASGSLQNAENDRKKALSTYLGLELPDIEKMKINPEAYSLAGILTPAQEQALSQGSSLLNGITTDPRLVNSQDSALAALEQYVNGGMSNADQAAFTLSRNNAASEMQAKQGQILQEMQARGQGGSGAELLSRLTAAQSGTDKLQEAQMQQAVAQQQARMAALSQQGQLSTTMRNQDYGQKSDAARAQDAINSFNTQNAQSTQSRNVNSQNQAQQYNLTNSQNLANQSVQTRNQAQQYNKQLPQQNFNNQVTKANGVAGQYGNMANANAQQGANTAGMYAGIGQGVGTGLASFFKKGKEDDIDDTSGGRGSKAGGYFTP